MLRKIRFVFAGALVAAPIACAQSTASQSEVSGKVAQAVGADGGPADAGPQENVCDPRALSWAAAGAQQPKCDGPWMYRTQNGTCFDIDPAKTSGYAFYKHPSGSLIYAVKNGVACHVANADQLTAMGGSSGAIATLSADGAAIPGATSNAGECSQYSVLATNAPPKGGSAICGCFAPGESSLCGAPTGHHQRPAGNYAACRDHTVAPIGPSTVTPTVTAQGGCDMNNCTTDNPPPHKLVCYSEESSPGDCIASAQAWAYAQKQNGQPAITPVDHIVISELSRSTRTSPTSVAGPPVRCTATDTCNMQIDGWPNYPYRAAVHDLLDADNRPYAPPSWMGCGPANPATDSLDDPDDPAFPNCASPFVRGADGSTVRQGQVPPEQCGANMAPAAVRWAPNGLSLKDVQSSDPYAAIDCSGSACVAIPDGTSRASAQCVTGQDLPVDTADGVQYKHDQLMSRLQLLESGKMPDGQSGMLDPNGGVGATVAQELVGELKLLFETHGDWLTASQQNEAIGLYTTYQGASFTPQNNGSSCGQDFKAPKVDRCAAQVDWGALNGVMDFCTRMNSYHVNGGVAALASVQATCIDAADKIGALSATAVSDDGKDPDGSVTDGTADDPCAFKVYRRQYDSAVTQPLRTRFASQPVDLVNPTDAGVVEQNNRTVTMRMALFDRLYSKLEADLYRPDKGLASYLYGKGSAVEGSFWQGIYRQLYPKGDLFGAPDRPDAGTDGGDAGVPTSADPRPLLQQILNNTLVADRRLVTLAFTPCNLGAPACPTNAPPMKSAALLYVMGDALTALSQRLDDVSVYHDLGCAYVGCQNGSKDSELTRLYGLLSKVGDGDKLSTEISVDGQTNSATGEPYVRQPWLDVFAAVQGNHAALESAVDDAWANTTYDPTLLGGGAGATPSPAIGLSKIVRDAVTRQAVYVSTGLLDPASRNKLVAGVDYDSAAKIQNLIAQETSALDGARSTFDANLLSAAHDYLAVMQANGSAQHLMSQIVDKDNQLLNASHDYEGLSAKYEADTVAFAALEKGFADAASNGKLQIGGQDTIVVTSGAQYQATLTGSNARWTPGRSIALSAVDPSVIAPLAVSKGQILSVDTSGKWAPTCALRGIQSALGPWAPPGTDPTIAKNIDTSSNTGPEGYMVEITNGQYKATSHVQASDHKSSADLTTSESMCAGVKAEAGFDAVVVDVKSYVDTSWCIQGHQVDTESTSLTNSNSDVADTRTSGQFVHGLRVPGTPFPDLPVGSMVLVLVDGSGHIVGEHVVLGPRISIVAPADSTAYIVINDVAGCTDSSGLGVSTKLSVAATGSSVVASLLPTMVQITNEIAAQGDAIKAQGKLLPTQAVALKSQALTELSQAAGTSFNQFPPQVVDFFNAWIDHELVLIEEQADMYDAQRNLAAAQLELRGIWDDFNMNADQARFAQLIPAISVRNLDTELLRNQVRDLVHTLSFDLYPLVQIRHPALFTSIQSDTTLRGYLDTLVNAQWDMAIDTLAQNVVNASNQIASKINQIDATDPGITTQIVVVDFQKPDVDPGTSTQQWAVADSARAQLAWETALAPGHQAVMDIRPQDIYALHAGIGRLNCQGQVMPVIRNIAVALGSNGSAASGWNPGQVEPWTKANIGVAFAPAWSSLGQSFAFGNGLVPYELENPDWAALTVPVFAVSAAYEPNVAFVYNGAFPDNVSSPMRRGVGLSPFARFTVDLTSYQAIDGTTAYGDTLSTATDLYAVMRVEVRQSASGNNLGWVPSCN